MRDGAPEPQLGVPAAPPGAGGRVRRVLRHRPYRFLLAGQFARGHAQWTLVSVLPLVIVEGGGSATLVGLVWALQFGPILLIAPIGGVLADRLDKPRLLTALHVGLGAVVGTMAVALATGAGTLALLVVGAAVFGVLTALEMPVRQALVPDLVASLEMPAAIAVHQATFNGTRILSPSLATGLLLVAGPAAALSVGAAASLVAAATMGLARTPGPGPRGGTAVGAGTGWAGMCEGFAASMRSPAVPPLLAVLAIVGIFGTGLQSVVTVHLEAALGLDARLHGVVLSAIGLGSLLGSLLTAARGVGTGRGVWWSSAALCLVVAGTGLVRSAAAVLALALSFGIAYGLVVATSNTLIQASVGAEFRGRVMSHYLAVLNGAMALGSLAYGVGAEHLGTTTTMVGAALLGLLLLVPALPRTLAIAPAGGDPRAAHADVS